MTARWAAAALLLALATGCAETLRPVQAPNRLAPTPTAFSHAAFDRVLARFVDDHGLVDYAALARRPFDLDAYLGQVAAYGPDRSPQLFPDEAARLAYWLNAYNAIVLRLVLEHRPIASVLDVRRWWSPLAPEGAAFFAAQQIPVGGRARSLHAIENRVIRRRFADPRIHFALNCASLGCPALPREAFDPARLEAQLARETQRFLAEPRSLRVDDAAGTVWLSAIFDWYRGDFERWQTRRGRPATVLDFVADHAAGPEAEAVRRAAAGGYALRFAPWDWRLNDRALGRRPEESGWAGQAVGSAPPVVGRGLDLQGGSAHHAGTD